MITINGIHCLEGDSHITNDIRRTGTLKWDPTFEKILQHIGAGNGRTMVDVGAYIGDSTKWFEDAGFKCHAFEPMPDAFECLKLNAHPDTICDNVAIGNGQTYATIDESEGNLGGRSLLINIGDKIAPTLDSLFPYGIDVLKIDAEGFEPFILEGAKETLKKKPIVIIEINEEALSKFGFSGQDILKHLEGYEFEEVYRYGAGQYDLVCFPKMEFAIAMPVCNRPEYTRKAIEAIQQMEGWNGLIFASVDRQKDGTINNDVVAELRKGPALIRFLDNKLGCNGNVKAALDFAWESNPDVVICIEDDVVVTPDAFRYVKWATRRYKCDTSYRTIGLWSHKEGWTPDKPWNPSEPTHVMEQSLFSVWGWAVWRDRWQEMSDNWTTGPDAHDTSWDVVMLSHLNGRKEVVPSISRANNIGDLGGTHRRGIHPAALASGFDTRGPFWSPLPQIGEKKKKVLVCLGRNGDNYMVAKAATEPCIIVTSHDFSQIIRELFPQHELFIINKKVSGLAEAMQYANSRYPDHLVLPCQQHGMPKEVQVEFRNFQIFQEWQTK